LGTNLIIDEVFSLSFFGVFIFRIILVLFSAPPFKTS